MTPVAILVVLAALIGVGCGGQDGRIILATTTSTQDSGLLDVLAPLFEEDTGYDVDVIAVGSGAAMQHGRDGNADLLLVHSPAAEEQFVEEGYGVRRARVMYNDFVLVGPSSDPAGVAGSTDIASAMAAIADSESPFFSRGDDSGTHAKERTLWAAAGLETPVGASWYAETGQGMGATLTIAGESRGYALTDRATWLSNVDAAVLPLLVEGDERLFNVYHVIVVDPARFPDLDLNTEGADAFRDFLLGEEAQSIIATFGEDEFGQPLFVPYPDE
ncbi:MAG: substrate-binding domain-containing protein [Dehalococcoidia bacterium]|nr:substrate-binding domain-containing protein [Dehalococcoidia bacterium]